MFELRHLRAFIAVAEELHFGRAASRLNLSQPPLTQQILQLEREVGATLLDRNRRGVRLTAAGDAFLIEARRIYGEAVYAADVARRAASGQTGTLRIGFASSASIWPLPQVVQRFRRRFPSVRLRLEEGTTERQLEQLRAGRLDAGFVRGPMGREGEGLHARLLRREPMMLVLPASHPRAAATAIDLRDMQGEPFVLFPRHVAPGYHDAVLRLCGEAGFSPHIVQEASAEYLALVGLVAAEVGITLIPVVGRVLARDSVAFVPIKDAAPVAELLVAHRAEPDALTTNLLETLDQLVERAEPA